MMHFIRRLVARVRHRNFDEDLAREIAAHRAMLEDEALANGASPATARHLASRQLGNVTMAREAARGVWIAAWLESLWQDVRHAARGLWANPGFTLPALCVLIITMGLTTGVYATVESVLLRPWPVPEPHRVVAVNVSRRLVNSNAYDVGMVEYQYLREHAQSIDLIARQEGGSATLRLAGETETIPLRFASGNYFDVLRLQVAAGRPLAPADDVMGPAAAVVVISHDLWQRRFGGRTEAIGSVIAINDVPVTIVGVTAAGVRDQRTGTRGWMPHAWMPVSAWPALFPDRPDRPGFNYFALFFQEPVGFGFALAGRLRPGVDRRAAETEIRVLATRYAELHDVEPLSVSLTGTGWANRVSAQREVEMLSLLSTAVVLMLLLGCASVGNLQLARGLSRRSELAVRGALGATRGRLIRLSIVESLLLSLVAAGASLILAALVLPGLLQRIWPVHADAAEVGWRAGLFAAGLAVGTCLLAGLLPALSTARLPVDLRYARSGAPRLRTALLAFQIAGSVVLLVGAGLLVRGVHHAAGPGLGFDLFGTVAVRIGPPASYTTVEREQLVHAVIDAARRLGLPPVAGSRGAPYTGGPLLTASLPLSSPVDQSTTVAYHTDVSSEYFEVLGIPLLAGRLFDKDSGPDDVVVSESLARWLAPGETAVDRVFFHELAPDRPLRILGVVGDTRAVQFDTLRPEIYASARGPFSFLLVNVRNERGAAVRLRDLIQAIEPAAVPEIVPLGTELQDQLRQPILVAAGGVTLGLLALLLAAVGTLGVFSYVVSERTREIGVRMTLGARARDILQMLASRLRWPLAGGLVIGLLGAQALGTVLDNRLYGISPHDPTAYLVVLIVLLVAATAATWIPARRALRVDPAITLRAE